MSLEDAAEGYKIFDKAEEDCRKIVMTPGSSRIEMPEPVMGGGVVVG